MGEFKLNEQFQGIIDRQIQSGRYETDSEVVEAALTLLEGFEQVGIDEFEAMRARLDEAFDDPVNIPLEEAFEQIDKMIAHDKIHWRP